MKKEYIKPAIHCIVVGPLEMMAGSPTGTGVNTGNQYGPGMPSAKVWDGIDIWEDNEIE
ncbi:MAG: hypothetical protein SPH23_00690 [Prevotella sp.]|nr:hypothetical protein [Prevotellaceae bacterium]MDY5249366.1 hypothetical protein [Prevotella sp.]